MVVNLIALRGLILIMIGYNTKLSKNNLVVPHFLYLIQYNDKLNLDWFLLVI